MNSIKPNVLMVGASRTGGVATYIKTLAPYLSTKYEIHMTVPDSIGDDNSSLHGTIKETIFDVKYSWKSLLPKIRTLRRIILENQVSIIHLHTLRAGLLGCIAAYGLPVKIIYTPHGWRFEQKPTKLQQNIFLLFDKFVCCCANNIICISKHEYSSGLHHRLATNDKLIIIPTQIPYQPFQKEGLISLDIKEKFGIPAHSTVIANIAKLYSLKDPFTFLEIAHRVKQIHPEVFFLWIGDGELRAHIEALAHTYQLENHFRITGMVSHKDIPQYLLSIDIFLCTSLIEVVPLSILEALAAGKPVTSSAYIGVDEVIDHGKTGLIFPIGDVQKAVECICKLLEEKSYAETMGIEGQKDFLHNRASPQEMAAAYLSSYQR